MKTATALLLAASFTAIATAAAFSADDNAGPAFGQAPIVPQLGNPTAVPSTPAPSVIPQRPSDARAREPQSSQAAPMPSEVQVQPIQPASPDQEAAPKSPRQAAQGHIRRVETYMAQRQYDAAAREASQAIVDDPEHAAEYRAARARAYLALGRYEEAFADQSPLEVTVTVPSTRLKSGKDTVTVVPSGTKLMVSRAQGNWLRVVSSGNQQFDWAWVQSRDVRVQPDAVAQTPPAPIAIEPDPRFRGDYVPPDPYIGGPGGDYGRAYYDWWQHVPPPFWRFLPR